jgi:hypothetical protein
MVSGAQIRLNRRKSVRRFKQIFCADISEFESSRPSHAVGLSASLLSGRRRPVAAQCRVCEFITMLGGAAAAAWPLAASAQQAQMRRIGVVLNLAANDRESQVRIMAFRQSLFALGWAEGHNIQIEYRFLAGDPARIRPYVGELITSAPDAIVAHTSPVVAALKDATHTIPVIMMAVNDPNGPAPSRQSLADS